MRRSLRIILVVVVALLLVPFVIHWLTMYRYLGGQPVQSFLLMDAEDFNQMMSTNRAFVIFRQCRTTLWLMIGPMVLTAVAFQIPPTLNRLAKTLSVFGTIAAILCAAPLFIYLLRWHDLTLFMTLSLDPLGSLLISDKWITYAMHFIPPWGNQIALHENYSSRTLLFWATSIVGGVNTSLMMPLWMPIWITGLPTLALLYASRRPLPGHCRCGYNLTGNTSGICPECGNAMETSIKS